MFLLVSEEPEDPSKDAQHAAQHGCSLIEVQKIQKSARFFFFFSILNKNDPSQAMILGIKKNTFQ